MRSPSGQDRRADPGPDGTDPLLSVRGLRKHYPVTRGLLGREVERVRAVDGVDFVVGRGETLGLVGESGCGKSTVASTALRLEEPTDGTIRFDGAPVTAMDESDLQRFRRRAQLVFQDPNATFNPRMTVAEAVGEPLSIHGMADRERRRAIVRDLLERVGLDGIDLDRHPQAFSGGQKQRLALARSLVLDPDLLVADEPVSGLDVSVQASVLSLMADLQETFDLSILFISHDMSVVREFCDRIAVMYLGEIVERGPVEAVFQDPAHPYTKALLEAIPSPESTGPPAEPLAGEVPDATDPPDGCRFHTRCPVLIQPEGLDLDTATWHRVFEFRQAVERGDVEPAEFVDGDAGGEAAGAGLEAALRTEFDLPATLGNEQAEAALQDAITHLVAAERPAAVDRLRDVFVSPCERGDSDGRISERPRRDGEGTYRCERPH